MPGNDAEGSNSSSRVGGPPDAVDDQTTALLRHCRAPTGILFDAGPSPVLWAAYQAGFDGVPVKVLGLLAGWRRLSLLTVCDLAERLVVRTLKLMESKIRAETIPFGRSQPPQARGLRQPAIFGMFKHHQLFDGAKAYALASLATPSPVAQEVA